MDFVDIMERVSQVVEKELGMKPTNSLIANYLGITTSNFSNMKKRNSIPYEEISLFSAKYKVSINWVLFNQHCESLVAHEEKFYSLKVIDRINASCGGGAFEEDEAIIKYINLDKKSLENFAYSNTNNLEGIKIIGDSMMPTLEENSLVLVDRNANRYKEGKIFLVNTNSGLFIKRLFINSDEDIDLVSDNELYSTVTMSFEEVRIMGRVVGVLE